MIDVTKFDGHTPGPWVVRDDDPYDHVFTESKPHRRVASVHGGLILTDEADAHGQENRANANLLAAAPELLAEVMRLRERVKELKADAEKHRVLMESLGNMPTEHPPIWDSRNVSQ